MEVVNNIAKETKFPNELLHTYISNCISACEKKNNDTYFQYRQARLVRYLQKRRKSFMYNILNIFFYHLLIFFF